MESFSQIWQIQQIKFLTVIEKNLHYLQNLRAKNGYKLIVVSRKDAEPQRKLK